MMLKRTMDAAFLNGVVNHEAVRPMLGGDGALDLSGVLSNPDNVGLVCEHGGFVGIKLEIGVYECHSMFLPETPGHIKFEAMKEGLRYLFVETDCLQVVTKCPANNPAATGGARAMGFVPMFSLSDAWAVEGGAKINVDVAILHFHKWLLKDDQALAKGKWFHQRLEEITTAAGKPIPEHKEDEAHNRAVGACCLMFAAGNPIKGQATYNLWAKVAGFPLIRLVSLNPRIVDMDQVIVGIAGNDMEVLKCR